MSHHIISDLEAATRHLEAARRRIELDTVIVIAQRELCAIRARKRLDEAQAMADDFEACGLDPGMVWDLLRAEVLSELEAYV